MFLTVETMKIVRLKGKEHKNTMKFSLTVFDEWHILMQTAWKFQILGFEGIGILCFQNGFQWRLPF